MKPAIYDASACQHAGEPKPVATGTAIGTIGRRPDITEIERQIADLANRSTPDPRVAWRQLHHTGPRRGLSRDLLIRALANQLQEQSYGGVSAALRRRLRTLSAEFEKGTSCSASRIVLKAGTTLVRQWRGRVHTVLVRVNGFEYQGQHYRSLTVNRREDHRGALVGAAVLGTLGFAIPR